MSRAAFDALRGELEAQRWNVLDVLGENALGPHMKHSLSNAALWAARLGVTAGWFKADYAGLVRPDLAPPEDEIAATLEVCRANGERSRYGRTYLDLLLRWAWAEDGVEHDGLPAPYEPLLAIFRAGAGINGEHGFIGPGMISIPIGAPDRHLPTAA